MDVNTYLIDHSGIDWSLTLQEWDWVLPSTFDVWLLSRAGDLFITVADGSIQMLDVGGGALKCVASSKDDFVSMLDDAAMAESWLMTPVVDALVASGLHLQPNQCYSYRLLPILGGDYGAKGRVVLRIEEHFSWWGSVQRQVAELPDGAEVVLKRSN